MDTIVQSEFIITPYYDHIIKNTNEPFWYEFQSKNHTPYDFFVLKTRLTPYISKYQNIGFDSHRYEGQMRYFVNIADANIVIPLSKEQASQYQYIVNHIISNYPQHCTLLYDNQTFLTSLFNKPLSNQFVQSILPYCYQHFIDDQYEPILYDHQLLITIQDENYNHIYNELQNQLINELYKLYKMGTIALNPTEHQQFISDWQLIPLYNNIYTTTWTNSYINDLTQFLDDQLNDRYVVIEVDEQLLTNYDYHIVNQYIFVKFNNYDELKKL